MSFPWSFLVDWICGWLPLADREVVLGDFAEAGESHWGMVRELAGLVLLREASRWPAWAAAVGLAVPGALVLIAFSLSVGVAYGRVLNSATGLCVGPGVALFLCHLLVLSAWRWAGGWVADPLWRRVAGLSVALAFVPCVFCITRVDVACVSRFGLLVLMLPGVVLGFRRPFLRMRPLAAVLFAVGVTALTVPAWFAQGAWLPNWLLAWPAWLLVGMARQGARFAED